MNIASVYEDSYSRLHRIRANRDQSFRSL